MGQFSVEMTLPGQLSAPVALPTATSVDRHALRDQRSCRADATRDEIQSLAWSGGQTIAGEEGFSTPTCLMARPKLHPVRDCPEREELCASAGAPPAVGDIDQLAIFTDAVVDGGLPPR